ncbi:MAG: hypothetical protein WCY29_06050 [Novosphingobium sp.]
MCFKQKTPELPKPTPAPDRGDATAAAQTTRRRLADQQSTYGNIFTSVLGDSNYGQQARRQQVAALGAGV